MTNSQESANPAEDGHLRGLMKGIGRYVKARLSIFFSELKSAGKQYGTGLALAASGMFAAVLGYVLFVIAIVFAISAAWPWEHAWIAVLGIVAFVHLLFGLALIRGALNKFKTAAFEITIHEFKEDQKWTQSSKAP